VATGVTIPTASVTGVPAPTDAQLRRFWTNNPSLYATPEYRRIKVIVLSADTLAKDMTVSDDEIRNYYNLAKADYQKPERRSVQILTAPDVTTATKLATAWQNGADWTAIQTQSTAAGATALELPDAKQIELPDPALGKAAFAAAQDAVSAPIKGDFGWYVVKVTKITPGVSIPLDQARAEIRGKIGALKANDAIDDHANKVEDALAGGGGLDTLPAGLGVAAVAGTLNAQGNTPDGLQAPLPAFPELRDAIIAEAFKTKPGDAPHLDQLPASKDHPAGAYYAVTVDSITPPSQLAYDRVADRVRQDWTQQQMRHAAETEAAQLLAATRAGTPLATAAAAKGLTATTLPPIPRPLGNTPPPDGVPAALVAPLFGMKQNDATMVETDAGFVVAQLQSITDPLPATDTLGAGQLRDELTKSVANDVTDLFVQAIERASKVTVNQKLIAQIAQP
jgi:peptidyl-prolyl cis-trans isomerase D